MADLTPQTPERPTLDEGELERLIDSVQAFSERGALSTAWYLKENGPALLAALKAHEKAVAAFGELCSFTPEMTPPGFKGDHYEEGDEEAPFMTEAYLYNLLGKEDARSVLMYARRLAEALGTTIDAALEPTR